MRSTWDDPISFVALPCVAFLNALATFLMVEHG
jgi:hypothetical protein